MALIVANTTNVKEMKNGRPMNVEVPAATEAFTDGLPNCLIVKLGETKQGTVGAEGYNGELDHVYEVEIVTEVAREDLQAGLIYVIVAPEIMVEEARKTDGHIGKFRFKTGDVHTAYQLSMHDRLELSANHPQVGLGKVISSRPMATGAIIKPAAGEVAMGLYEGARLVMKKIEFAPAAAQADETEGNE